MSPARENKKLKKKEIQKNKKPRIGGVASSSSPSLAVASALPLHARSPTAGLRATGCRIHAPPGGEGSGSCVWGGGGEGRRPLDHRAGMATTPRITCLHRRRVELRPPHTNASRRRAVAVTDARTRRVMGEKRGVREREVRHRREEKTRR